MGRRRSLKLWRRHTIRALALRHSKCIRLGRDARVPRRGSRPCGTRRLRWHRSGLGLGTWGPSLDPQLSLHINTWKSPGLARKRGGMHPDARGYIPFSNRMRSSKEFLYRSIRHSSAALRWLCCRLCKDSSLRLMVVSSCRIYSVRRSRKAA